MKHAKKTLAKKPGPGREKADKICVDHFLDEVLKNMGDDSDPNSFYDDINPVEDMRRQLEDLKINLTKKMNKAIKKSSSKPKSSHRKNKSKSRTKKKKSSKRVNAHIISDESSSDSSDSENSMISSENKLETNTLARSWNESESDSSGTSSKNTRSLKIPTDNISLNAFFAILRSMVDLFTRIQPKEVSINGYNMINRQTNILPQTAPEGSQSEAEISWPNPIEINFIRKIIPNDVATICCKISLLLGKIIQVSSAMIDSRANCSVISKGLIKLLEAEVDKNKKPSVKWYNNSLESSGISYNISVTVGQGENSCTISEDFPVMDDDKPWILLGTLWLDRAGWEPIVKRKFKLMHKIK
ncbi:hypothetical protein F8M41_003299 [Gigaspora margarita]|uniref:Uncharacterized protein n=1 Tax=Gigaspora margarita TaxID=4874 RepID=A0A8H4ES10_GIGMA|nr:hypothetical protein F8M41_003299 [Gigaspora margarita]